MGRRIRGQHQIEVAAGAAESCDLLAPKNPQIRGIGGTNAALRRNSRVLMRRTGLVRGLAAPPALRKLTACLVQDARHHQPSGGVSDQVQVGMSVIDSADENGGDDRGDDRFAWKPVELESHADLYPEERTLCNAYILHTSDRGYCKTTDQWAGPIRAPATYSGAHRLRGPPSLPRAHGR